MTNWNVIWPLSVREKLIRFRSEKFTPDETFDFITDIILETEVLLKNDVLDQSYTEEFGKYQGISRIVIKRFRIYFRKDQENIIILAILFPGEK